jgi:dTDP-4-amino-4,6-dideoxygalactose transaminase
VQVRYSYLDRQYQGLRQEILDTVDGIFQRSAFILRPEVAALEGALATRLGASHAVGVNSGTDALYLGIETLKLPTASEVITTAHTFVSTIGAIVQNGLKPVLVDIADDYNIDPNAIEAAVTPQTRAIMVVHLNGRVCRMDRIEAVAKKYDLIIVEDAAQAIDARFRGRAAGTFGKWGAFSLHPMKVIGAAGDGGFVTTNDPEIADDIRMLRNIGQRRKNVFETFGHNSRLDTLQAAICLVKLRLLSVWISRRRALAARYDAALSGLNWITLPPPPSDGEHYDIYSSYIVRTSQRDALRTHLERAHIETMIHWWPPLCAQPQLGLVTDGLHVTERMSREVISLPIDPDMTDSEQDYVIETIRGFAA